MAKKKSVPHLSASILLIGVGLAILIGIAYLAKNLTASQAAISKPAQLQQLVNPTSANSALYPTCQKEFLAAIKKQENNAEYRQLSEQLNALMDRYVELYDIAYDLNRSESERQAARAQLDAIELQMKELAAKRDALHDQIWAEYNACIANYKAAQPKTSWWGRVFSRSNSSTSSTATPTTSTSSRAK